MVNIRLTKDKYNYENHALYHYNIILNPMCVLNIIPYIYLPKKQPGSTIFNLV
jgi:hypothetical protein